MGRSIITHIVILQAIGLSIIAFIGSAGAREGGREPAATLRLDARDAARIELRGSLKCPMPESNTGHSCTLTITEVETGKVLRIVASNTAMRLFQDGQTQVVATGTVIGDALKIIEIRAE